MERPELELRIISCIASATEIVHALGLGRYLVGRSHECDWPPAVRDLPICTRPRFDIHGDSQQIDQRVRDSLRDAGSVYEVLTEVIDSLAPAKERSIIETYAASKYTRSLIEGLGLTPRMLSANICAYILGMGREKHRQSMFKPAIKLD